MDYKLFPQGDQGIIIELGSDISTITHQKIRLISAFLEKYQPEWIIEYIPSFTTITIFYHPIKIARVTQGRMLPYQYAAEEISKILSNLTGTDEYKPRTIEIPVCYGGNLGPDLEFIAKLNSLTPEEVIEIHTSGDYLVYMIGFAPGFPYLGGMSEKISAPRKKTPRLKIPAQSVGIAGKQTGVYPLETPGGWQIIGRTPHSLFRPHEDPPTLLKAGDKVKFTAISLEEFIESEEMNRYAENH
ncbi:5-oxoprolinase subunit PxpB [Bacillus tuaregi]|uniref:5-oxoprolinase subunit PxpB n=1 Tax=Bacillus tuaregi TaxID=1816695 RepID=UPI0008F845F2|nr:5-oxoprolinase subunit PxpB [Bacillus tuaregi]